MDFVIEFAAEMLFDVADIFIDLWINKTTGMLSTQKYKQ